MNQEEFEKIIQELSQLPTETETVEFKENHFDKSELGKRISAISNAANLHNEKFGYLVFGIQDSTHTITGTKFSPKKQKVGAEELEFWLSKHLEPSIDFRIYERYVEGKYIVLFFIPPANKSPVRFENIAYIRVGSTTPKLNDYPEKEKRIWDNINRKSFEKNIARENLTSTQVLELLDYDSYFSLTKQELPTNTQQFVERMVQHGLVKRVRSNSYDITNLGAVLFARNLNEFSTVKRKSIRIVLYDGNTKVNRMREQEEKRGYAISFEALLEYINDKLPYSEEISQSLRKEVKMYPEKAVREFVANALIHQDLSISGAGPMVEIFDSRIEITNTGEPLIDTNRFIDHPPRSRNEDLAAFMRQIGVCEEGGTGIDRALLEIALYQLPAPSFESLDKFTRVTMYARKNLKDMSIDDKVRACFQHCVLKYVEQSRMTNATLRDRLGIGQKNYPAASQIIRTTIEKGYIKESDKPKEYVPTWA